MEKLTAGIVIIWNTRAPGTQPALAVAAVFAAARTPPCITLAMNRRFFLRAGLAVGGGLALFGGAVFWRRGLSDGQLTESGRETLRGIARGVLDNVLPAEGPAREAALDAHVQRMAAMLNNAPPMLRQEISLLLGALGNPAGRLALAQMSTPWSSATVPQIQAALQTMRTHPLDTPKMAYGAVRDLTCISYFASPEGWAATGYPGPVQI